MLKNNKTLKRGLVKRRHKSGIMATLSLAALAGLTLFGLQANAAADKSALTDASLVTFNGYGVNQTTLPKAEGTITGAAASIPVMTNGIYTVTETEESSAPNVFKYAASDGSIKYYEIGFTKSSFGYGDNVKYYKWSSDANGVKLIETDNAAESVVSIKYDEDTVVARTYVNRNETKDEVNELYVGQSIKSIIDNRGTIGSVDSQFIGNTSNIENTMADAFNYSAILAENSAKYGTVKASFAANTITADTERTLQGTLIKVLGEAEISAVDAEFIGNSLTSVGEVNGGFAEVATDGKIGTMKADFINNSVTSDSAPITGGQLSVSGVIESLTGNFIGNTTYSKTGNANGNLANRDGKLPNVFDMEFIGNTVKTDSGSALGGAIYNGNSTNLKNVIFLDNSAQAATGTAKGGAIYTDTDLNITADGGLVEFTGNYVKNGSNTTNQAIWVEKGNTETTLTLEAKNGGKVLLNDNIDGLSGYKVRLTGDSTGEIDLYGDINNANVVAAANVTGEGGLNVNLINNAIKNYTMLSLSSDDTAHWALDVDFANKKADNFTLTNGSTGTLYIDKLNLLSEIPTATTKIQVVNGGTLAVKLSDALVEQYHKETQASETTSKNDTVKATSTWNDKYYTHIYRDFYEEGLRTATTTSGRTNPDSIEYYKETTNKEVDTQLQGDTLRLLNQMSGTRSFSANSAEQVYEVTEDLGSTAAGTLNINGVFDSSNNIHSAVNFGEKTGFLLNNDGQTTLNLNQLSLATENSSTGSIINAISSNSITNIVSNGRMYISAPVGTNTIYNNGTINVTTYNYPINVHTKWDSGIFSNTGIIGNGKFLLNCGTFTFTDGASIEQDIIELNNPAGSHISNLILGENSTIKATQVLIKGATVLDVYASNILSDITNNGTMNLSSGTLKHKLSGTGGYTITEGSTIEIFHDSENPENSGLIESTATNKYLTMNNNSTLTANADDIKAAINYSGTPSTMTINLTGGRVTSAINLNNQGIIDILGNVTYGNEMGNLTISGLTNIASGNTLNIDNFYKLHYNAQITNNGNLNIAGGGIYNGNSSPSIVGEGTTTISGSVITQHTIQQAILNLTETGALEIYPQNLKVQEINNDGELRLHGNGTISSAGGLASEITGTGKVVTAGNSVTISGIKVSQGILVKPSHALYIGANNINGEVENNGNLYLNGISGQTLKKNVSGTGTLQLANGVGSVINEAIIKNTVFTTNSYLTTNADNLQGDIIGNGSNSGVIFTGGTYNYKVRSNGSGGQGRIYIDTGANVTTNGAVERIYYGEVRSGATWTANGAVAIPITIQSTGTMYANSDLNGATIAAGGNLFINADNLKNTASVNNSGTNYGNLNLSGGEIAQTINGGGNVNITGDVTMDEVHRVNPRVTVTEDGTLHVNNGGNLTNGYLMNEGKIYWDGDLTKPIQGENGITYLDHSMNMTGTARIDGTLMLENGHLTGYGTNKTWNTGKTLGESTLGFDVGLGTSSATHFNLAEGSAATFDVTNGIHVTGWDGLIAKDADESGLAVGTSGIAQVLFGDTTNSKLIKSPNPETFESGEPYYEFSQHRWKDYTDDAQADVYFDDSIGHHHKDGYIKGILEVATTVNPNDSVKWIITQNYWEPDIVDQGDLLHQWNIVNPQGDVKYFRFRTADDVYKSQVDVGTAFAGGDMNVIGVAADNPLSGGEGSSHVGAGENMSTINLDNHTGFVLPNTTKFNIKNINFKNGNNYYIQGTGVTSGGISAVEGNSTSGQNSFTANGAYEVTGGIENVNFSPITYSGEGTTNVSYIPVSFTNSNISQIKDTTISGNSFSYTNTDTVYSNPNMYAHALTLNNTKIGQSFTDEEGNTVHVGGMYNVKISDNTLNNGNLREKRYEGLAINLANKSYIANIINSEFKNNVINNPSANAGGGAIVINGGSSIGTIQNTVFDHNIMNITNANPNWGTAIYVANGTIDLIKDSEFTNNVSGHFGGAIALSSGGTGIIKGINNATFDSNKATVNGGGALFIWTNSRYDNIINSRFTNNTAKTYGGAIYSDGGKIGNITDTIFENNTASSAAGGAISASGTISSINGTLGVMATDTENNTSTILQNQNTVAEGVTPYTATVTTSDGTKYDISATTLFKGNTAVTGGGAISSAGTISKIDGVLFEGNKANVARNDQGGSAIAHSGTIQTISNSVFINNESTGIGGAIYNTGIISDIINSYFIGNIAKNYHGGAIANISRTQINSIQHSAFIDNQAQTQGYGGAISIGAGVKLVDDVLFLNNSAIAEASGKNAGGGAIDASTDNALNFEIIQNSTFKGNYAKAASGVAAGGGIYVVTNPINTIKDTTFTGNYAESKNNYAYGGAIYAGGNIGTIDNVKFNDNYISSNSTTWSGGGALFVANNKIVNKITNSEFKANHVLGNDAYWDLGGAIHVEVGSIGEIANTLFEGNYVENTRENQTNNAGGGAIYAYNSTITNGIINSRFIDNYVKSAKNNAVGGAIQWRSNLNIFAKDNGLTEFTGNYVLNKDVRTDEAIYIGSINNDGNTKVLTLNANTGGHILFNDIINGNRGYDVVLTGDNTGTISIYNDIRNADVISNTAVNIDTADGKLHDYQYKTLTSSDDAKYTIDIDFANVKADNFTLDEKSSGTVYIDNLNVLANNEKRTKVQVLKTLDDGIQLGINGDNIHLETDIEETLGDTVYDDGDYSEKAGYALSTTDTKFDSITQLVDKDNDALRLITASDKNDVRNFVFNTDNEYKVFEDLTDAAKGTINIQGHPLPISDETTLPAGEGNVTAINADGHKMFNLDDNTLNLSNVKIYGSEKIADMTAKSNINTEGTVELRGKLSGGTVNVNEDSKLFVNKDTLTDVTKTNVTGTLGLENSAVEENSAGVLEAKTGAGLSLDMDLAAKTADSLSNGANSKGTLTVNYVNYLNGSDELEDFTVQVLKNTTGNNNLQLAIAEDINKYTLKTVSRDEDDEVQAVTGFHDTYWVRTRQGDLNTQLTLATTQTTNDSIHVHADVDWETSTTQKEILGDTLKLVTESDIGDRSLVSTQSSDLMVLNDTLDEVGKGTFTISGTADGEERSTINLMGETFTVGEDTTLTIGKTRITGSDDIIHVTDGSAVVNLDSANIDGNITGDEHFTMNIEGQERTTITGEVKNATVNVNKGEFSLAGDTFKDSSTILNVGEATVNLADDEVTSFEINDMTSSKEAKYILDVDFSGNDGNGAADNFVVNNGSGKILLEGFNITGDLDHVTPEDDYTIQIIKTNPENDLKLTFSDTVISKLQDPQHLGDRSVILNTDTIQPITKWDDVLNQTVQDQEVWGRMGLSTTDTKDDSIHLYDIRLILGETTTSLGDTLRLFSKADLSDEDRHFVFDSAENTYDLSENIGETTAGNISIDGVADGEKLSSIDMHKHNGWGLNNETTLNLNNVEIKNTYYRDGGVVNISNGDAVLNMNNVKILQTNSNNAITNSGTVNMTGGTVELNTGISGSGKTNVLNGTDVIMGDTADIAQAEVNVTDGTLTMGDRGEIKGALNIGDKGTVTVGVEALNNSVANDGDLNFKLDGTLSQNVNGEGTTHILGNVVNGAKINQDVDIKSGASLDSHTDNLGGKINNDGDLLLAGSISDVISGTGETTVNQTLDLMAGAGVDGTLDLNNGTLSAKDNLTSDYNIGKLLNEGSFALDMDGATQKADKFIVGADSEGKININDLNIENSDSILEDFTALVTSGSDKVSITLSDEIKAKDWKLGRISRPEEDEVNRITKYTDLYHTYSRGGNYYGHLTEVATNHEFDSIGVTIDESKTKWDDNRTTTGLLGDSLNLWNTLNTQEDKEFRFDRVASYEWKDGATGAGKTAGSNVTLAGFSNNETSKATIDFTGKTGFELDNATTLNVNDMNLKGGDLITVNNSDAKLNIKDSFIEGNIKGSNKFAATIAGNDVTTLRGVFTNSDTTLNSGKLKLNTDTFASSDNTVKVNGGTVVLDNNSIEDYVINDLTSKSDAGYTLDINLTDKTADTIAVQGGNGIVKLANLNIKGAAENPDDTYIIQILKVADGDLQLDLSDEVKEQIKEPEYKIGESTEYTRDFVKDVTNWKDIYYNYKQVTETYGNLQLATKDTTNDSLGIKKTRDNVLDIENTGSQGDTLKVVNQSEDVQDKTFQFDTAEDKYDVTENLGGTKGNIIIDGVKEENKTSTIDFGGEHSGFELTQGTNLAVNNTTLTGAKSQDAGSLIKAEEGANIELNNVSVVNNQTDSNNGGAIDSKSDVKLTADDYTALIDGNKTASDNEAIYMGENAKLTLNAVNNGNIVINDKVNGENGYKVGLTGDNSGNIYLNNSIDNANVEMDNITLNLASNDHFTTSNVVINSGVLNLVNDKVQDQSAKKFTVAGDFKLNADVDLKSETMDRLPANTTVKNGAFIHVDRMNLLSDTTAKSVAIPFAYKQFKGNVDYIGAKELSKDTQVTTAYAPIYKYSVEYQNRKDMGYFVFTQGGGSSDDDSEAFNPAILASPVAMQAAGEASVSQAFRYVFEHADAFSQFPAADRFSQINSNVYALSTDYNENLGTLTFTNNNKGAWVRPYTAFENMKLDKGPKVDSITYGTIVGGDSDFRKLRNGWANVGTVYVGYNGSQIDYKDVSTTMNGGLLGLTETFYKGNFFTALTATAGAGVAESHTMYGKEDMTMLMAGIGSKTGYNLEFKEGKFIVQPILFMSYTMVNAFDYTNAAGVKIDADPMHTIQINPSIRFIANTKNGWQPYASVGMVWNLLNETEAKANGVKLPEMHTKPYVEYGIGLQRHWGERFTAFAQTMIRNGGRNGVALTAGFRWSLGDGKQKAKKENKNVFKKQDASKTSVTKTDKKITNQNPNITKPTENNKTVIKSLNKGTTKAANLNKYYAMINE